MDRSSYRMAPARAQEAHTMKMHGMILSTIGIGVCFGALFFGALHLFRPVQAMPKIGAPIPVAVQRALPHSTADVYTVETPTYGFGPIEIVSSVLDGPISADELAMGLALAMNISRANIVSAQLWCDPVSGGCTDPAAVAVMGMAPGTWFPTRGESFALLSTGRVTDIETESIEITATIDLSDPDEQEILNGLNNTLVVSDDPQGNDLARLHLVLTAPDDAKCLGFDYAFYTTDVYTDPNSLACTNLSGDTFTAQYNDASLGFPASTISGFLKTKVIAPGNFAFNTKGEMVTSYTVSPIEISHSFSAPFGTIFPEIYPLLQARRAVSGGEQFELYLSIQDIGDSIGNSAVALDNFEWITDTTDYECPPDHQMGWSGDQDGDGLPNGWERYGKYTRTPKGELQYIDLKRLGADPAVKDIFVEIDSVKPLTFIVTSDNLPYFSDPLPISQAMTYVVNAFARAPLDQITSTSMANVTHEQGIRLHVDYGPHAPLTWGKGENGGSLQWGGLSGAEILSDTESSPALGMPRRYVCGPECVLAGDQIWQEVDLIKSAHFSAERSAIFHYALFAHDLYNCEGATDLAEQTGVAVPPNSYCASGDEGTSGEARLVVTVTDGGSDFLVTLGHHGWQQHDYPTRTVQQAGTFMHELGHNFGLLHSGTTRDITVTKPNHLSVMNYLYQTDGLVIDDPNLKFDYLRYDMAALNEFHLNETMGIQPRELTVTLPVSMGARHYCELLVDAFTVAPSLQKINWDCVDGHSTDVKENITGDRDGGHDIWSEGIIADSEWDKLVYAGAMLFRQRTMLDASMVARGNPCLLTPLLPLTLPRVERVTERILILPTANFQLDVESPRELTPEEDARIAK